MPAIPDSLLYFDCTPVQKWRSKRNGEMAEGLIAIAIACPIIALASALPWSAQLASLFSLGWGAAKLVYAKQCERRLQEELVREVMEQ